MGGGSRVTGDDDESDTAMIPVTPTSCDNKSMSSTQAQVPSSRRGDWSKICAGQKEIKSRCARKPADIVVPTCSVPAATAYVRQSSYGAMDSAGVEGFFGRETSEVPNPEFQRKFSFIEWKTNGKKPGRCGAPAFPKCTGFLLFAMVIITVFATIYLGYLLSSEVEMSPQSVHPAVQSDTPHSEHSVTAPTPPRTESAARLQRETTRRSILSSLLPQNHQRTPLERRLSQELGELECL